MITKARKARRRGNTITYFYDEDTKTLFDWVGTTEIQKGMPYNISAAEYEAQFKHVLNPIDDPEWKEPPVVIPAELPQSKLRELRKAKNQQPVESEPVEASPALDRIADALEKLVNYYVGR